MVEIEYLLDAVAIRAACQSKNVFSSSWLEDDLCNLMRFRVNDVEVLRQSEEGYERWMKHLKDHHLSLHVPSSAWSLIDVLAIAMSVDAALRRLLEEGHAELFAVDDSIWLDREGDVVRVYERLDTAGYAQWGELSVALTSFAERLRGDLLALCPQLRNHATIGWWLRGEDAPDFSKEVPNIIYLPAASDHEAQD